MSIFEAVIGWLAPTHCLGCQAEGQSLCEACVTSEIMPFGERCYGCGRLSQRSRVCVSCRRTGSPRFVWISSDYSGAARDLMRAYKFGHTRTAAKILAQIMDETFQTYNSDTQISKLNYLIVPVPSATSRTRGRGFDHARLLAQSFGLRQNLNTQLALGRLGQTRQLGAKRSQRLVQPKGSYLARQSADIRGRNILLVDDVLTTGATILECSRVLRAAGASHVDALVFAKRL